MVFRAQKVRGFQETGLRKVQRGKQLLFMVDGFHMEITPAHQVVLS